ncbi:MAG: M23 family metallopeptidase, partial [Candidatus Devosia euplotis]|nr:M23 family metallopeptidase [Candidatus Devosia euplotis]
KLRALTMVSDPDRNLAIGPGGGAGAPTEAGAETEEASLLRRDLFGGTSARSAALVAQHLEVVQGEAHGTSEALEDLSAFLGGQQALLSATPSRAPTHGYVTSGYGMRVDPFTGLPQFHSGIGFSAQMGAKVAATADSVVIFAGRKGAYGNVVEIEHETGFVTKFAHLSEINVSTGDKARRGQTIGAVGNTGRSTGPHLHYEVRLRGIAQNPQRFLLE